MSQSPLHAIANAGQSIWSDQISRSMLDAGELTQRMRDDAITGVTSNPSIFAAAIAEGDHYDDQLAELADRDADTREIVAAMMTRDLQRGCDVMRPVWDRTDGRDGFVSVEVDPEVAHDTEASLEEAREWVKRIDRPNLLVKIPATEEGIPAIRRALAEGISINVTLIFSIERYLDVMEAYLSGLEDYRATGGDISKVSSVASFFVSRVDTEVDGRLESLGGDAAELRGLTAIANARIAYDEFLQVFRGERWESLVADGARVQRPLWASTSTKDPDYRNTMYVDTLVAPHTVNTMPLGTVDAYQAEGPEIPPIMGPEETADARNVIRRVTEAGIDMDDVFVTLEREGVEKFVTAWRQSLSDIEAKRDALKG
jgi:transaldolase